MSSSVELSTSFDLLTIEETETPSQSFTRKNSPAWEYCRRPMKDEDQDKLYCAQCTTGTNPSPYGTTIAENMKNHLRRHHQIYVKKRKSKNQEAVNHQLRQLYYQAQANDNIDDFNLEILQSYLNKGVITEALISLIVVRNLSFCLVEWPEFHTLCQSAKSSK